MPEVINAKNREKWLKSLSVAQKKYFLRASAIKLKKRLSSFFDSSVLSYWYAVAKHAPYYGGYLFARQNDYGKLCVLLEYLERKLKKEEDVVVLEVGSWAGSSTFLIANLFLKYNRGKVYCIDTWKGAQNVSKYQKWAARNDKIMKMFYRNMFVSNLNDYVVALRGKSEDFYGILKSGLFDAIYIDGDHAYSAVRADTEGLWDKLKVGGMFCGDDYDCCLEDVNKEHAIENRERDYILDPKTGWWYHPGVTLAINDTLQNVNRSNMFWWKIK